MRRYFEFAERRCLASERLRLPWMVLRARSWVYGVPRERVAIRWVVWGEVRDCWPRWMRCLVRWVWVRDSSSWRRDETCAWLWEDILRGYLSEDCGVRLADEMLGIGGG